MGFRIARTTALSMLCGALMALVFIGGNSIRPEPANAVPGNDNFANAINVSLPHEAPDMVDYRSVSGAATEAGERVSFGFNGCSTTVFGFSWDSTVWYNWTSPATPGTLYLDTWGSSYGTSLVVYTGNAVNALTPVAGACNYGNSATSGNPAWVPLNYAANTTYRIQVGRQAGTAGTVALSLIPGVHITVNSSGDSNAADGVLTLREAILLAVGGTGGNGTSTGLGRALDGSEIYSVQGTLLGASSLDMIRFHPGTFPPGAPVPITFASELPILSSPADTVSGAGAGVIIDGVGMSLPTCIRLGSGYVHLDGLQVKRCFVGVQMGSSYGRVGGYFPPQYNYIYGNVGLGGNGIGVNVLGDHNEVIGNYLGVTPAGDLSGNGTGIYEGGSNSYIYVNRVMGSSSLGMYLTGDNGTIGSNQIGFYTGPNGNAGNGSHGVYMSTANGYQVSGNTIGNNAADGIQLSDSANNAFRGNYIGTNSFGNDIGNGYSGIAMFGALSDGNVFGGPNGWERNVISGNGHRGLYLVGGSADGGTVQGNYIGVGLDGVTALPNLLEGVYVGGAHVVIGGMTESAGNVISGNSYAGVYTTTSNHMISYNKIGLGADGTTPVGNGAGVVDAGTGNSIVGNTISGNVAEGVGLRGSGGFVASNHIGTEPDGIGAVKNWGHGIYLDAGSHDYQIGEPEEGNFISGNHSDGIHGVDSSNNLIYGNRIGVDSAGADLGNGGSGVRFAGGSGGNVIGGSGFAQGNVISGNEAAGILIESAALNGGTIQGNFIGVDPFGTADRGNTGAGIVLTGGLVTVGGTGAGAGNVISGNNNVGIYASTGEHVIQGNLIGVDINLGAMPNSAGVRLELGAYSVLIGGGGGANTIAHNVGAGVVIEDFFSDGNTVRFNSIYANGGLGIDLLDGANGGIEAPTILGYAGGKTLVGSGACPFCPVDIYADSGDEGKVFIGTVTASDTGTWFRSNTTTTLGAFTATVSPGYPGTSEFSAPYTCVDADGDAICAAGDNCPGWNNPTQQLPPWPVEPDGEDLDCDGFINLREQYMGTDPMKHCPTTATANDEPVDAWPSDFNDSRVTSLADVVLMGPVYNQSTGTDPAKRRFDLNASGSVSLADVVLMGPFYNKSCG